MRTYRIKVEGADTWYHCYNRTVGTSADRPLGPLEKEQFVRILKRVSILYGVRVVAYQVMSNHFHLLLHAPAATLSVDEIGRRYEQFHRGRRKLDAVSQKIWQARSRDISWFMRHLQHLFTVWYNRSRPMRRRGSLWADRFKHTILDGSAVWPCWKYIESNAVRAGMVSSAGDYRFCSYGCWVQSGRHPFKSELEELLMPLLGLKSMDELKALMEFSLRDDNRSLSIRVRHWTYGLVIGPALFIRSIMSRYAANVSVKELGEGPPSVGFLCLKQIRAV